MITVRGYEERDIARMSEIWNEVVLQGIAFPQEEALDAESGRAFFASQSHCGVAEEDGRIVGMYILHPNNVGRCGHICNASYAVDSRVRGKGVGEALVRNCMKKGAELGFRILQFNAVVKTNAAAMHLYEKLGFTPLGVIPGGFRMPDGSYADIVPHYRSLEETVKIRKATMEDLSAILSIYENARSFMAASGNPDQWGATYPPREQVEEDISSGDFYVCEAEGCIHAAFWFAPGEDPAYQVIEGAWKNDEPYAVLHRVVSSGEKRGMMDVIVRWAFEKFPNLRMDTHERNLPMQRAMERNGFERCGVIYVRPGAPRIAYHKTK